MTNYFIVAAGDPESLEVAVDEMLAKGYEPTGGLVIDRDGGGIVCYQAMWRRDWNRDDLLVELDMATVAG